MNKDTNKNYKPQSGYIKLYRNSFHNDLYFLERFTKWQAWVDLLMLANHKPGFIQIRGNIIQIKRGQLGWSIESLSQRWKWNQRTVKKFLDHLTSARQLTYQTSNVTTIISVCNYNKYQNSTEQNTYQTTEQSTDKQECIRMRKKGKGPNADITFKEIKEALLLTEWQTKTCTAFGFNPKKLLEFSLNWLNIKEQSGNYNYSIEQHRQYLIEDFQKNLHGWGKQNQQTYTTMDPKEAARKIEEEG